MIPVGIALLLIAVALGYGLPLDPTEPPDSVGWFLAFSVLAFAVISWWVLLDRPFSIAARFGTLRRRAEIADFGITLLGLTLSASSPFVLGTVLSSRTARSIGTQEVIGYANNYQVGSSYSLLGPNSQQLKSRLWGWQFSAMPGQSIPMDDKGPLLHLGPILTGIGARRVATEHLVDVNRMLTDVAEFRRTVEMFRTKRSNPRRPLRLPDDGAIVADLLKLRSGTLKNRDVSEILAAYAVIPHEALIRNVGRLLLSKNLLPEPPLFQSRRVHRIAVSFVLYVGSLAFLAGSQAFRRSLSLCARLTIPLSIGLMLLDWIIANVERWRVGKPELSRAPWVYLLCFLILSSLVLIRRPIDVSILSASCWLPVFFLTSILAVAIVTIAGIVNSGLGIEMTTRFFPHWASSLVAYTGDPWIAGAYCAICPWLRNGVLREIAAPTVP